MSVTETSDGFVVALGNGVDVLFAKTDYGAHMEGLLGLCPPGTLGELQSLAQGVLARSAAMVDQATLDAAFARHVLELQS